MGVVLAERASATADRGRGRPPLAGRHGRRLVRGRQGAADARRREAEHLLCAAVHVDRGGPGGVGDHPAVADSDRA